MTVQAAVEGIVDGLFSALVTLGTVPIIKCPKVSLTEPVIECQIMVRVPVQSVSKQHTEARHVARHTPSISHAHFTHHPTVTCRGNTFVLMAL